MSIELIWDDQVDKAAFEEAGFRSFDDFWNIEQGGKTETEVKRQHLAWNGKVERQTVCLPLNGKRYFLKRTSGRAFHCVINEFEALSFIGQFGLISASTAVHCFDEESQRGFVVFKDLAGFYSLYDVQNGKLTDEQKEHLGDEKRYFPQLIEIFKKFQQSDYFYRDWLHKHIFFNPDTDEIALIDLERFLHKSRVPFFWCLPLVYGYKRKKEREKFLKTLKLKSL